MIDVLSAERHAMDVEHPRRRKARLRFWDMTAYLVLCASILFVLGVEAVRRLL